MDSVKDQIRVADQVVAVIAGVAAQEIEEVAVGGSITFYDEWTKRLGAKNNAKGIMVEIGDMGASITLWVSVRYGTIISKTCQHLQEKVKETVEFLTGLTVYEVNVRVEGLTIE
ncbi:Asp23/Gls24 family envelope stress response protein [Brevibacillus laterosporus]|uniref:Alkaline shock protein n=1 Tax=Brevibacillus laterosporus LMG 15441 TaxID=1042163 RepID=A0A075QZW9_BRELA|nr:Asp23/Gls24 family envelope stress response protein [Brevibacillus laterosporus]AIG25902.1 alkaline shock protein [Brevibacillus laterosporus LMG 15441]RJL12928.1 Asp23/Gls24 family envelope stress response protein [Brevibacillus laterosporus]TPH08161.1 Asp23/Gls24 family envelope stress response protein [Brevibacillus laterosporus]